MIKLLVVGKTTDNSVIHLTEEYLKRIHRYCSCKVTVIPALKNVQAVSVEEIKKREGDLLINAMESKDTVILLDESGESYTSVAFSLFLQRSMNTHRSIVFVIGGAYGFSEKVYQRATHKMALSPMTFSHQMVRIIFLEQLYRAFTILNNEPYHHA